MKKNYSVSETLLLAVIPVVGYAALYLYEVGIANFYGIPYEFIQVNIYHLVILVVFGLSLLWPSIAFIDLFRNILGRSNPYLYSAFIRVSIPTAFFLISLRYPTDLIDNFIFFYTAILLLFLEFVFPLITNRRIKGYYNKLKSQEEIEHHFYSIADPFIRKWGSYLLVCAYIFFAAYSIGYSNSSEKTEYLRIVDSNQVIVKKYNDYYVTMMYQQAENKLDMNQYTIINFDSIGLQLEWFNLSSDFFCSYE